MNCLDLGEVHWPLAVIPCQVSHPIEQHPITLTMPDGEHRPVVHRAEIKPGHERARDRSTIQVTAIKRRTVQTERRVDHRRIKEAALGLRPAVHEQLLEHCGREPLALLLEPVWIHPRRGPVALRLVRHSGDERACSRTLKLK